MRCCFLFVLLCACGGDKSTFPPASNSAGGADNADSDGNGGDGDSNCGDEWLVSDEVATQPGACLVWSPMAEHDMDWYTAASEWDGQQGACGSDCPDGDGWCASLNGLDGRNDWRLPSKDEITEAAQAHPPFEDIDEWIWSRDTDGNMVELAYKGNLADGGASWSAGKDTSHAVRCVANP